MTKYIIQFVDWLNHYTFKHGVLVGVEYTVPQETANDLSTATILEFKVRRFKKEYDMFGSLSG